MRKIFTWVIGYWGLIMATGVSAQQADGGFESLFSYGVGARALGLGGAYIAAPGDASAVYWNPGGLDLLTRKTLTAFYANLPLGGQYNFVGYVHPTVSLGTFGVSILRVGTEGIPFTDEQAVNLGTFAFAQTQFLAAYGKNLPYGLSVGASLKVEQQDFLFSAAPASGRGVGLDAGMVYAPPWLPEILQNATIGFIIQNAIPPIYKVAEIQQRIPRAYKIGFAVPIQVSSRADAIAVFADLEKGEEKATKLHLGAEYSYHGNAMLRIGFTDNQIVYGAGAAVGLFRIDYSYGSFSPSPELPQSHRISLSLDFGKTRQEIIELAQKRRDEAIAAEVTRKQQLLREIEIKNNLDAGRSFYQKGDYFSAYLKFTAARDLDPENKEANQWVQRAEARIEEEQRAQQEQLKKQLAADAEAQQKKLFVENQLSKGIKLFNAGKYNQALSEWQVGLEQDPNNAKLKLWIQKTQEQIGNRVTELRRQADRLAARGRYLEAIDKLSELKRIGVEDKNIQQRVEADIARLQRRMNYSEAYRRGVTEYFNKNYKEAMRYFQQAASLEPNNRQVQEYLEKADARANARDEPFKNAEIQNKYKQAAKLFAQRKYEDALVILEEIQKQQPYNKRILKIIDDIEEILRKR